MCTAQPASDNLVRGAWPEFKGKRAISIGDPRRSECPDVHPTLQLSMEISNLNVAEGQRTWEQACKHNAFQDRRAVTEYVQAPGKCQRFPEIVTWCGVANG